MPNKRVEYIQSTLNTLGDPVANALVEPITGLQIKGDGLVLGDYFDMTDSEALSYSTASTLYGGRYQRILLDSGANLSNVSYGKWAYYKNNTPVAGSSPYYTVTDVSNKLAANLPAGVFLSSLGSNSYFYGFIQTAGKATLQMKASITNGSPAVGDILILNSDGTTDDPTQSSISAGLTCGRAFQQPASGAFIQAWITVPFVAY